MRPGLHGIVVIDKPAGPTSFGIVAQVRVVERVKKVGHLGTLDPFATGVLPLLLQEATKLAPFLADLPKTYQATMCLGVSTDTQDATGTVTGRAASLPPPADVAAALTALVGDHWQTPPMYSAVQVQGRRLYHYARQGLSVTVPPRRIRILSLQVDSIALPLATFTVTCSKGTYIRTLAADVGRSLGCGAHLQALRRLAVGPFTLEQAVPWPPAGAEPVDLLAQIIPLVACLPHLPTVAVDPETAAKLRQGQAVAVSPSVSAAGDLVKIVCRQDLVAVATWTSDGSRLQPVRVFHAGPDQSVGQCRQAVPHPANVASDNHDT